MITRAQAAREKGSEPTEIQSLRRALDQAWADVRENASREWQRQRQEEAADRCVTVRVGQSRPSLT